MNDRRFYRILEELAHELKTPITVLRSRWEREIADERVPLGVRRELVGDVEELARLGVLIDDALLLARLEREVVTLERKRISLLAVFMEVTENLQPLAEEKGQRLSLVAGANVTAFADPRRMAQVAVNLIQNAVKYAPEGSRVTVRLWEEAGRARFTVEDEGPGISPEELETIFEPFARADGAKEGSGLGLALCRGLVLAHGGTIRAENGAGGGLVIRGEVPLG